MPLSFGGFACLDPKELHAHCVRQGLPVNDWWGIANSFSLPLGSAPGRGWLLMARSNLIKIDPTVLQTIVISDGVQTATLANMVFVNARCVTPGVRGDPMAAYLLQIADARWLADNPTYGSFIAKQYNVRAPAGATTYYQETLQDGISIPWTWQQIADDIWTAVGVAELGSSPTIPAAAIPVTPPEGFRFVGVSAWQAYNLFLQLLGCAYAPTFGGSVIIQLGVADQVNANAEKKWQRLLRLDDETIEGVRAKIPASVTVCFNRTEAHYGTEETTTNGPTGQWSVTPLHSIVIAGTVAGAQSSGTVVLWDDLPAIVAYDGTFVNNSDLQVRAQKRADDYYRSMTGNGRSHKTYAGIIADAGLLPGSNMSAVAWYDRGGGYQTETVNYPPLVRLDDGGKWQVIADAVMPNIQLPDIARKTFPIYPPPMQPVNVTASATTAGIWEGTVDRQNPLDLSWTDLEPCWIVPAATGGTLSSTRTIGRLNGTTSAVPNAGGAAQVRPVYVVGASGGAFNLTVDNSDASASVANVNRITLAVADFTLTTSANHATIAAKNTATGITWVRVSSLSLNGNGYYPAFLQTWNHGTLSYVDGTAVQAKEVNGAAVRVNQVFEASKVDTVGGLDLYTINWESAKVSGSPNSLDRPQEAHFDSTVFTVNVTGDIATVSLKPPTRFPASLTSTGGHSHVFYWSEVTAASSGLWGVKSGGRTGTTDATGAYEFNLIDPQVGDIVWLEPGFTDTAGSTDYRFPYEDLVVQYDDATSTQKRVNLLQFTKQDFSISLPATGQATISTSGFTGTLSRVTDVTCSGSTLTVTKTVDTYRRGLLVSNA